MIQLVALEIKIQTFLCVLALAELHKLSHASGILQQIVEAERPCGDAIMSGYFNQRIIQLPVSLIARDPGI